MERGDEPEDTGGTESDSEEAVLAVRFEDDLLGLGLQGKEGKLEGEKESKKRKERTLVTLYGSNASSGNGILSSTLIKSLPL